MKDIPFTSEVPKAPGAYYFKKVTGEVILVQIDRLGPELDGTLRAAGPNHYDFGLTFIGEWSPPLVPTSTLKTAVKEAWEEGWDDGFNFKHSPFTREELKERAVSKIVEES